jgi:hypothetical protein
MDEYDITIAGFQGSVINDEGKLILRLKSGIDLEIVSVIDKSPDNMPYLVFNTKNKL